jgi:hypothetical protein
VVSKPGIARISTSSRDLTCPEDMPADGRESTFATGFAGIGALRGCPVRGIVMAAARAIWLALPSDLDDGVAGGSCRGGIHTICCEAILREKSG